MQLSLHNGSSSGVTIISNIFIDYYMPRANGEFVKIYLYLLRSLQSGDTALDLAAVADVFDCTESDVLRTLRYWENQKLVVLAGTDTQTSIDFLQPMVPDTVQNTLAEQAITQISCHIDKHRHIRLTVDSRSICHTCQECPADRHSALSDNSE